MASGTQTLNLADPQIAAVREHLDQVLSSPEFATSERSRRLLRFLVETTLSGQAERLKEYVIGLEVFDRNPDYDPRIDSTVRVQAGKLRDRLKSFYNSPERQAGIRIELPKGGYAAVFVFPAAEPPGATHRPTGRTVVWSAAAAVLGIGIGIASTWFALQARQPAFRELTFRRGPVSNARFNHAGNVIVYSATWGGERPQLFSTSPESPESRPLGFHNMELLAIAPDSTLAVLNRPDFAGPPSIGTLATTPLTGTLPRDRLNEVSDADWSPDSSKLAVVTWQPGKRRLEFPPGHVLYETSPTGWINDIRVSPAGDRIAFLDHRTNLGDDEGWVATVDLAGRKRVLAGHFAWVSGLAWAPSGKEIWFAASSDGVSCGILAVTLSGKQRVVANLPGLYTLFDVSADGRVLLSADSKNLEMEYGSLSEHKQSDASWMDGSLIRDMSADGATLLFDEEGAGGGATSAVYLRRMDGSAAVRLGTGFGLGISPDGKWVLARQRHTTPPRLILFPTGAGEERPLAAEGIAFQEPGAWFSDGRRLLLIGAAPGHRPRNYVYELDSGRITAVTPEGRAGRLVSPDMKGVPIRAAGRSLMMYPFDGSAPRPIPGTEPQDFPLRWSASGGYLFVRQGAVETSIYRVSLSSGLRVPWATIKAGDPTGVITNYGVMLSADGDKYAISFMRWLSTLYLVEGLR